jgi:ABC-type phosphate transport system substrate-binding protein
MNTTEFTNFRLAATPNNSQEKGVNPSLVNHNPLNLSCTAGGGKRMRGIGTGEVIKNGVLATKDSIGYTFFGFANVAPIAGTPKYGYLKLNGVDPIQSSFSTGQLPKCTAPCPKAPGTSFPNLRNGTYRSWSVLRVVTDASGTNLTNTQALVTAMQNIVNSTVPDFVPFKPAAGDPGLSKYRSHYLQSGVAPHNGLGGQKETGGDVGGCIEPVGPPPGVLNCHQ